jgi:hypothetical protein
VSFTDGDKRDRRTTAMSVCFSGRFPAGIGAVAACDRRTFLASQVTRQNRVVVLEVVLDKTELHKLQAFLRRAFGNAGVKVVANSKDTELADVRLGERKIATISVDDEDGDRSFSLEMKLPVERAALQSYLQLLFENNQLKITARPRKTDSVELNSGDDFLGVISVDDPKGKSFTLQMAILDYDLEDV